MEKLLHMFLRFSYRPYAKQRKLNLALRARNVLLIDENESTRYMQRNFARIMEAQS